MRDLSDVGLVALALNVDNIEAARLIAEYGGVRGLALTPPMALGCPAFHAALELARRANLPDDETRPRIDDWESAANLLVPRLRMAESEELHAIFLTGQNTVIETAQLGVGSERFCIVDPAMIIRRALMLRAGAIILGHNHPSGDPVPSCQDIAATRRVSELAVPFGISLFDHIIVGRGYPGWTSLAKEGLMPARPDEQAMYLNR